MKELDKKIKNECKQSILLREKANNSITLLTKNEEEFRKSEKIRKEQDKQYKKYVFFKNLGKAIDKENKYVKKD